MNLDLPIYPGHPMTLAVQIAEAFPTLEAAHARDGDYPAALGSSKVDGAGGYVYCALEALDRLRRGESLDAVLAWADAHSEPVYRAEWPAACEQARRYLARIDLRAMRCPLSHMRTVRRG